jgi:ABC-type glutathione transport system ATPase component
MKEENTQRPMSSAARPLDIERSGLDVERCAVSIRRVSMIFPGKGKGEEIDVLEDVTADVAHGEFVCIVGPSGCGKSTLLNIVWLKENRFVAPIRAAFLSSRKTAFSRG